MLLLAEAAAAEALSAPLPLAPLVALDKALPLTVALPVPAATPALLPEAH